MMRIKLVAVTKLGNKGPQFDCFGAGTTFSAVLSDARKRLAKRVGKKARYFKFYIA